MRLTIVITAFALLGNALSNFYTPHGVMCPREDLIRNSNTGLSEQEHSYIKNHHYLTQNHLIKFLQNASIPDFDINDFLHKTSQRPINLAIAVSGGGYRSMLTSSGFLLGMHSRGLFNCASYIASISGGSWTLMRLLLTNFNIEELKEWNINSSLLEGVPNFEIKNRDIIQQFEATANSPESITHTSQEVFMDEDFYSELQDQASIWKRSLALGPAGELPTFSEFYDRLERSWAQLDHSPHHKRSIDTLLKLKETFEDVFKADSEDGEVNQIRKLEEMMDSFSSFRKVLSFYIDLHSEVRPKKIMGFPVSFTDYWGRALWKKIYVNESMISSMSELFARSEITNNYEAPLPIIIANCKNEDLVNAVFEFTPFEFGSWNRLLGLFVNLKYLGSNFTEGVAQSCVQGFDDIGFITATSSSLFNNVLIYAWKLASESSLKTMKAIRALFSTFGVNLKNKPNSFFGTRSDFALFQPNPFYRYPGVDSPLTNSDKLYLVDGGEDGENIPLRPFLQPERQVDLIFALDSSSGRINYPTGGILRNLYDNLHATDGAAAVVQTGDVQSVTDLLPYIPSAEEFEAKGLLKRPVAFGCYPESYHIRNASATAAPGKLPPIVFYHANRNSTYNSNTSTFKLRYNHSEVQGMLENGASLFTHDNNTAYFQCVGCLVVKRAYDNVNASAKLPPTCQQCFRRYCYN
ncbi:AAL027Wp [Eremothecium gossypii ATCC 10895]|uniref:Lysophospholipase n=1 Tax=Eremothecium gossypii (strain ATCC 10895 / CBS 109.51 / FGSC 9923 / NRRL Y-1056) TaxID=284811 RepID=Q75F84_EREGS|nr:AAL027Wp [Eremothecium gossypii ATCC 10895]AAS50339.2 AAL027Wp [Eremothecium gossypii ATCC 10895]AEY94625.1 FAAL027Wp [Eremothecium gossypii FDAG1]